MPENWNLTSVKSPKSSELPVVAIVINCIQFSLEDWFPPAYIERRGLLTFAWHPFCTALSKSPKSCELPLDAIFTYSIVLTEAGSLGRPPILIPRVALPPPEEDWAGSVKSPKSVAFPVVGMVTY